MPIKILMPALSPTMTEGNLVKWVKKEGDQVKAGDLLAEIETDKTTIEFESADEGKLAKIIIPEGTEAVKVNSVIAILLEEGESESDIEKIDLGSKIKEKKQEDKKVEKTFKDSSVSVSITSSTSEEKSENRTTSSPLARRIADEKGLELDSIKGSGPNNRIVKKDVENFTNKSICKKISDLPTRNEGLPDFEKIKVNNMRKTIAQRLTESKQTIPHFYLTISCNIDKLLDLRKEINKSLVDEKISVNDMIVRACALALNDVPNANASWHDDHIKLYKGSDISIAVSIDDGLVTPIVRDAQLKSVTQISRESRNLIKKARSGQLSLNEFQGGTITISNLGMYGIQEFGAIVNPPQGCILSVGAGEKRAVVIDDKIKIATIMNCTLSVDHRVIDGSVAAEFFKSYKNYIENPILLSGGEF